MLFRPLKTRRAFEEISAEIKRLIFSGAIKPGQKLPTEIELAGQFGVSRPTIREALRRLEIAGFISMQKGGIGGPLVVDTIMESISASFLDAFQMKKMTTDDLTRARLAIEKMILSDLPAVLDEADLAALRANVLASRRETERGRQAFEQDVHFHRLLAGATKNHVFIIIMEALLTVVAHFHSVLRIDVRTSRKAGLAHVRILEALEANDRGRAMAALETHVLEVDRTYRSLRSRRQKREAGKLSAAKERRLSRLKGEGR